MLREALYVRVSLCLRNAKKKNCVDRASAASMHWKQGAKKDRAHRAAGEPDLRQRSGVGGVRHSPEVSPSRRCRLALLPSFFLPSSHASSSLK